MNKLCKINKLIQKENIMKTSKQNFVYRMLKEAMGCKYLYKDYVYSLITALRKNYGIECEAGDDEIYAEFKSSWNACMRG